MNPLRDDHDTHTGIRVGIADITFPPGFERLGRAVDPDWTLPATMPDQIMAAYAWVRIEDGNGIGYTLHDLRLMRSAAGWFVAMPSDAKKLRCNNDHGGRPCGGRNAPLANYCNWCGGPLRPNHEARYHEFVRCVNEASAGLLLDAILSAYRLAYAARKATPAGAPGVPTARIMGVAVTSP